VWNGCSTDPTSRSAISGAAASPSAIPFLWLGENNTNFGADYSRVQPTLVGYESLRALKLSCLNLGLSDTDVERIFYGNAVELFGLAH